MRDTHYITIVWNFGSYMMIITMYDIWNNHSNELIHYLSVLNENIIFLLLSSINTLYVLHLFGTSCKPTCAHHTYKKLPQTFVCFNYDDFLGFQVGNPIKWSSLVIQGHQRVWSSYQYQICFILPNFYFLTLQPSFHSMREMSLVIEPWHVNM